MEAGALSALVGAVLPRAWRRESPWHGEVHWRCVTATALALAAVDERVDRRLVFCFGLLDRFDIPQLTALANLHAETPAR